MKTLESLTGRMGGWYNTASSATYALAANIKGVVSGAAMGTVMGLYLSMGLGCSGAEPGATQPISPADAMVDAVACEDNDQDGFYKQLGCDPTPNALDCDENNNKIYPGAQEIWNGADDDCDKYIDEDLPTNQFCEDNDGDLFGDPDKCVQSGFNSEDCIEGCDIDGQKYVLNNLDCDDDDKNIHPNTVEICDGKDNNCGGGIDENLTAPSRLCLPAGAVGECLQLGLEYKICLGLAGWSEDYFNCDAVAGTSQEEICDGLDNNCNGIVDDGVSFTYYLDNDGDGYGNLVAAILACSQPQGYVTDFTDCDDEDPFVNPGAVEIYNGIDDNCDGEPDRWTRRYGGLANGEDIINSLSVGQNGITLVGEETVLEETVSGQEMRADRLEMNYSLDGASLSVMTSGTPGVDVWNSIVEDSQGNKVFCGVKAGQNVGFSDAVIAKYGPDGNLLWEAVYNGMSNGIDGAWGCALTPEGNVLAAGLEYDEYVPGVSSSLEGLIAEFSPAGNLISSQLYNGPANGTDRFYDIAINPVSGGFCVAGESQGNALVGCYNGNGTPQWMDTSNGQGTINSIDIDPATGEIYATGGVDGDLWLGKYSPTGTLLWSQSINGPSNGEDRGNGIKFRNGKIYVAGYITTPAQGKNAWFNVYDQDGNPLLDAPFIYDGQAHGDDEWRAVDVDENGGAYVVGGETVSGEGYNIIFRKHLLPPL